MLYSTGSVQEVKLDNYLVQIASSLIIANNITLKKELIPLDLSVKKAIPIGMITSELITNSIKYAFPDNKKGIISLSLKKNNNSFTLEITDNGVGISNDINISNSDSFGLQLVNILTEQVNGNINIKQEHGTKCLLSFKN
jgi:two-component sensor histidine kinase